MDVRCSRCGTEYEFDDALVSERGTTVKCTNCGHQFKVRPPESGSGAPERWVVRTATGRELVYTSLRELQRGIAQRQVGPEDLLSRGNQPPRPLGSIAELEPFFQARGVPARGGQPNRTLAGVAPPPNMLSQTMPLSALAKQAPPVKAPDPNKAGTPAQSFRVEAEPQTLPARVAPAKGRGESGRSNTPALPPVAPKGDTLPSFASEEDDLDPPTIPRNAPVEPNAPRPAEAPAEEMQPTPTPSAVREAFHSYSEIHTDPRFVSSAPSRRGARSRWIAAVVILGVVGLLAATVGRRYLQQFVSPPASSATARDSRAAEFIARADKLIEAGDFEGARGELDKASVLSEGDPAVLAALARLETLRADALWLRLRLLEPSDEQLVKATHRQLGARVGRAEEAVKKAVAAAPTDPTVLRAQVDVLRLAGQLKEARDKIGPIAEKASEPENAYVLAALDLAEPSPVWAPLIDRLRTAAAAERSMGRARAALVYALVRDGQLAAARSELDKAEAKSYPLRDELSAFLARYTAAEDAGADAKAEVATVDPASLPMLDTSAPVGEEPVGGGDFRSKLKAASAALKSGQLDRAEQLYNGVLAEHPGNTEAMAGLGDVARLKRDPEKAEKMYEKVLEENPSYLPALVARADQKWESGDKKGAIVLYRRVLEQAGAGSGYGQKAAARIAQGPGTSTGSGGSAPTATAAPAPSETAEPAPAPTPTEKKEEGPHIDTTDLPEFN